MSSFLQLTILGLLGSEPDLREDGGGNAVCNFSVAHNEQWNDKQGQPQKKVTWIRVSCWGKQAENAAKFLHKGSRVLVTGTLLGDANGNPRIWQGNDGSSRSNFEMRADRVKFAGQGGNGEAQHNPAEEEDEIPF